MARVQKTGIAVSLVLVVLGSILVRVCLAEWIVDGDRFPPASGGTSTVAPRTYPVLLLELGGQWTDFELKATTNNFESLVYYVQSSRTNQYADDADVWVYFTDDYASDTRRWQKSAVATSIGSQLADPASSEVDYVLVCPSHTCGVNWQGWMSETNSRLVWSFVRFDGIDLERNAAGTSAKWSMTFPVAWREARIAP